MVQFVQIVVFYIKIILYGSIFISMKEEIELLQNYFLQKKKLMTIFIKMH